MSRSAPIITHITARRNDQKDTSQKNKGNGDKKPSPGISAASSAKLERKKLKKQQRLRRKTIRRRLLKQPALAHTGMRAVWNIFFGWLYVATGVKKLLFAPSIAERNHQSVKTLMYDAETMRLQAIVLNQKGGAGKTPVATGLGAVIAYFTQQLIVLFDTNQTKGNTASRIGVAKGTTLTLRKAVELFERVGVFTYTMVVDSFRRHPAQGYGSLRVIDSENDWGVDDDRVKRFLQALHHEIRALIFDHGNTLEKQAPIEDAKVVMFVARPRTENSLTDCLGTLNYYRSKPETREKANNGVAVIVGHVKTHWWRRDNAVQHYAEFFGLPKGRIVLIPHDSFYKVKAIQNIQNPDELLKVITVAKLKRRTLAAYLQLACLLYRIQRKTDTQQVTPLTSSDSVQSSQASSDEASSVDSPESIPAPPTTKPTVGLLI